MLTWVIKNSTCLALPLSYCRDELHQIHQIHKLDAKSLIIISDRLLANHYKVIQSDVDWNPKVFSSMGDLGVMACLSKCFFQFSPTCQFSFVVDRVCYLGNFSHSNGHGATIEFTEPPEVFLRPDLIILPDYRLEENQPKAMFAAKIFDVVDLSTFGNDTCKYYCFLLYAIPCDFFVIFDDKCWLGNQSDPTNYNLANSLPDTMSVYLPPGPPLSKLLKSLGFNLAEQSKNHITMLPLFILSFSGHRLPKSCFCQD